MCCYDMFRDVSNSVEELTVYLHSAGIIINEQTTILIKLNILFVLYAYCGR